MDSSIKNRQYYKFCLYGFFKNLRFFDAFLILLLIDKDLNFTEIGILYASREIIINIFEIPSGIIADTFGRKSSLLGSFVFYIFSFIIFYLAADFWLLFLAFSLFGIADAFRTGTHKGMIMDYLKANDWSSHRISYYGQTRSCSQKGSAISALTAGILIFYTGNYQYIFLFTIVPYLLNLINVATYPQFLNHSTISQGEKSRFSINETIKSFINTIRKPELLRLINISAVHSAYLKSIKDYVQTLMIQVAILVPILMNYDAEKKNGLIIGILYFITYLLSSKASKLANVAANFNKKQIAFITLALGLSFGIISGILYFYHFWALALIAFIAIFIIENLRKPILTGFISENTPNHILTSVISTESQLKTLMTAVFALLFGFLADYFGVSSALIILSSVLLGISILFQIMPRSKPA